ncbi:hypothetical protein EG832_02595 [bacterium]|nr:hypothetical protein [bacterium]
MLRISTTTVEAFRRFRTTDYLPEEKLIRQIKGEEPPSEYMTLGTAFHDIMENPHDRLDHDKQLFVSNGISFEFEGINKVYDLIDYSFPFEHKTEKIYFPDGKEISIVAKVDQLKAMYVGELKSCWSTFDYEGYAGSCQWKFYSDIFEALRVDYIVAVLKNERPVRLSELHTFSMYPYTGMQAELIEVLSDMAAWIEFRGLEKYFKPKEKKYEKISVDH